MGASSVSSAMGSLMSLAKNLVFINEVLPEFKKDEPKKKKCDDPKKVSKNCSGGASKGFPKMATKTKEEYIVMLLKAGLTKEEALKIAQLMLSIESK